MADHVRELVLLVNGERAGVISSEAGQLSLRYDRTWAARPDATPVSLSMPLAGGEYGDALVGAFLRGLLPDNELVLERWARTYQVSLANPFALLCHVGEDCAGAVQFVRPERVDAMAAGDGGVKWLTEPEVADRLRELRRDPAAWHVHDTGQFSLAGAQAKTALYRDPETGRWGEPWGAVPTTHILKPAIAGLDDHDLNEHLCLLAARRVGLPTAVSTVASFADERAIVLERYDRRAAAGGVVRLHQEDVCQALGLPPTAKYQTDGGPGPEQVVELLHRNLDPTAGADAVAVFLGALAFNWLIGGTDAHAKNYSILLAGTAARLAPLYDIASALPYDSMYAPKLRMAMKIGGEYRIAAVGGRHWRRLATAVGVDGDALVERIDGLARLLPAAFMDVAQTREIVELGSQLPARLAERVAGAVADARQQLLS